MLIEIAPVIRLCDECKQAPSQHPNGLCDPCHRRKQQQAITRLLAQAKQALEQK